MARPDATKNISLEAYAAITADMVGITALDALYAVARAHGLDPKAWDSAATAWSERLGRDVALGVTLRRLLLKHLEQRCAGRAALPLDAYVAIQVAVHAGVAQDAAFAEAGTDLVGFTRASYAWMDRFEEDPRLEVYFRLRVQKGLAVRTKKVARAPFTTYRAGNLVRARKCSRCGALKATKPLTAYVYCDYCATAFDYDVSVALDDPTALDHELVDTELAAVSREPIRRAFEARNVEAYAEIVRWQSEVATEVCPEGYSPRVADPRYRRALIDEVLVPWRVVTWLDAAFREASAEVDAARERAVRRPTLARVLALLEVSRAAWRIESALLEREGIFARHPDGYDAQLFQLVNVSTFVRPWLVALDDAAQKKLLAASHLSSEYVAAPLVTFLPCGCGKCGRKLEVPEGSRRMLCEACGFVLEVGERRFPCAGCGASSSVPAGAREALCAFCGVRWTL